MCQGVEAVSREQTALSGIIVYDPDDPDEPFYLHDVRADVSQPFLFKWQVYIALSPNHEWVVTYDFLDEAIWLSSVDGSSTVLRLDTAGIYFRNPYWIDNESLFFRWNGKETFERHDSRGQLRYPFRESMVIYPFETPMRMAFPGSRWPQPDRFTLNAFSPDMRLMLLYDEGDFHDFVYDPISGQSFGMPMTDEQGRYVVPQWLSDGSLAYTFETVYEASADAYQQEIFVSHYPFETSEQLTDLGATFGAVEFSGSGGVRLNWSPDTNYVIFNMAALHKPDDSMSAAVNAELYIYDRRADTTERLCIFVDQVSGYREDTDDALTPVSFHWSPDSQFVAFEHEGIVYAYDVTQKQLITLLHNVGDLYDWK